MILVKFKIEIGSDESFTEFSYFENLDEENYAGLHGESFVSAPEGKYIDANLLEEVYGEPEGGFEEAEQSVDVFDYGDDKSICVLRVYDLNVKQLETLRAFNIVY
tara:strand:+ start:1628 stop:1942 length:315 start_codon:yes stop_codon:yes gene_type:complete